MTPSTAGKRRGEETWASCCQWEQMEEGKGFPEVHCLAEKKGEAQGMEEAEMGVKRGWERSGERQQTV